MYLISKTYRGLELLFLSAESNRVLHCRRHCRGTEWKQAALKIPDEFDAIEDSFEEFSDVFYISIVLRGFQIVCDAFDLLLDPYHCISS